MKEVFLGQVVFFSLLANQRFPRLRRNYILERDGHICQFPFDHSCNYSEGLDVHHIVPEAHFKKAGGKKLGDPHNPYNGISLCKNAHALLHDGADDIYGVPRNRTYDEDLTKRASQLTKDAIRAGNDYRIVRKIVHSIRRRH